MKVERLAMSSSVGLGVSTGGEYLPARQVQHVQDADELITHQALGYYDRAEAAAAYRGSSGEVALDLTGCRESGCSQPLDLTVCH
ncbi:hypothetical protein ABZ299_17005 [Streptomyces sp. NPDC006184]|uniref:hypothetical protein n=1 Tax=Streptomyces sp. NPDC006184 TaxID=3155455 RepID=UPI0033A2412A